jgi:transcription elongation factor GreA
MPVRDALPAVLRGDAGADLSPDSRALLEQVAHDAQSEKRLAWTRDELGARLKQSDASWGVYYLLSAVCALNGEVERAQQTLLQLGDKLVAKKKWEPLAAVAERSLALLQTHAAARLLVTAHEGLGKDPARIDALSLAWSVSPDDLELALLLARRLGEAGQGDDRRALLAELAPRFAAEARWQGLEEAALEFVEHEDWDGLAQLAQVLPVVASQGAIDEARTLADISAQGLAKAGRANEALEPLRKVVATATAVGGETAGDVFRVAMTLALRQGPGATVPDLDSAVTQSGLEDGGTPLPAAIEQFDSISALAPGRGILHEGFGAGRIVSNDTTTVVIDFARSKGHKMPYVAARRTLTAVAEDDLRLLRFSNPEEVRRLMLEEQGTMVVRALKILGGSADANRLKVFLVGSDLVPPKEWTAFWRKARAAAEKDPRIDHTRAFEQVYQLAPEGAAVARVNDNTPLPAYEVRKPARYNLGVIRKFLAQHPQAEKALKVRFGGFIQRTTLDDEGERPDRARAGLYFVRWYPERLEQWRQVLRSLWEHGLSISDLSTEDDQLALLAESRLAGVEAEAILSALDSRFAAVRDEAEKDRAALDDHGRTLLRRTLLDHPVQYSAAVIRLIEDGFVGTPPADAWRLFFAALQLIEEKPKPSIAEKVLRWLEVGGSFERMLAGIAPTEEMRLKVRVLVRQWRSSDRLLFPALEAVGRVGLEAEKQWVLDHRQARTEKLFSQVGEQAEDFDVPIMTRPTWEKLKAELAVVERELKTTIPKTIQKARELGDLKENAEYHSAKLKQANAQKQAAALQLRVGRARFIEEAEYKEGVVGLGTEVGLSSDGERKSYWILGDGEQHLGENVISFQAPIGKLLVGRVVGDEVEIGDPGKRWHVDSVVRKLPSTGAETPVS